MNCRTCQHELSEYLDGRLASGRRAQVLDHLAECTTCASFWRELELAQQTVQRLHRHRTGPDFRERLFARIEAGEGTPNAVFREPIPLITKLRYTLSGAAAAAAVLIVASLLQQDRVLEQAPLVAAADPKTDKQALPDWSAGTQTATFGVPHLQPGPAQLAIDTQDPSYIASADASPLAPRSKNSLMGAVKPLTPDLLAVETARQFEQRHQWTSHCLTLLDGGLGDDAMVAKICDDAESLGRLGGVLTELRDSRCLSFADPLVDTDLRVFMTLLDGERMRQQDHSLDLVRTVVAPAMRKSSNLGRLTRSLSVTPSLDRGQQQEHVLRIARAWPELIDQIFFVLPGEPDTAQFGPIELSRTFVFSDECGPVYVAPMSELQGPEMVFQRLRRNVQIRIEARSSTNR